MVSRSGTCAPGLPITSPQYEAWRATYLRGDRRFSSATVETYASGLKRLEDWLVTPLSAGVEFFPPIPEVRRFVRESDFALGTIRVTMSAFKSWAKFLLLEGVLDTSYYVLLNEVVVPDEGYEPPPPLTPRQARILLDEARTPAELRLVYPGLLAGTRISESGKLGRPHHHGDRLRFRGKANKRREIPIHPELQEAWPWFADYHYAGDVRRHLEHTVEKMRDRVGFYFRSHGLRDTFCQTLLDNGTMPHVISDLLGHKPKEMIFRHYGRAPFPDKRDAVYGVEYQ